MIRLRLPAAMLAVVLALAACTAAPTEGPGATVAEAIRLAAAKDIEGLRGLACAGQEDAAREVLGLPDQVGDQFLPGLDVDALIDAVRLDVSGVEAGEPVIEGDVAQVPVTGSVKITFDAEQVRPILVPFLESQGREMTDEQLDALLSTLEAYGQDIPIDQSIRLVREGGTWKVCEDIGGAPS